MVEAYEVELMLEEDNSEVGEAGGRPPGESRGGPTVREPIGGGRGVSNVALVLAIENSS